MIIVVGHINAKPGHRDEFVALSQDAMIAARKTSGCRDFVVTADPLAPDRVHIYEAWNDEGSLRAFRENGPSNDLNRLIAEIHVRTFEVAMD